MNDLPVLISTHNFFQPIFSPVLLRRGSERVAWWSSSSHPRLTHHTGEITNCTGPALHFHNTWTHPKYALTSTVVTSSKMTEQTGKLLDFCLHFWMCTFPINGLQDYFVDFSIRLFLMLLTCEPTGDLKKIHNKKFRKANQMVYLNRI